MIRSTSDINILNKFTVEFCKIIEKYVDYIIVSGFVVISSGRVRGTEDIDMIIKRVPFDVFERIHNDLVLNGFTCIQEENVDDIYFYLKDNLSVRYTYKNIPLPEIELKFAKDLVDDMQFKTKTKLDLTGLDIWFSSIEMNIAFKEELLKSQKDLEDASYLREVYEGEFSEDEVDNVKNMLRRYR